MENTTNLKFELYDKEGTLIGFEYHEPNKFKVIQIYHESIRGDFKSGDYLKLEVREGYFIPHFSKKLVNNQ